MFDFVEEGKGRGFCGGFVKEWEVDGEGGEGECGSEEEDEGRGRGWGLWWGLGEREGVGSRCLDSLEGREGGGEGGVEVCQGGGGGGGGFEGDGEGVELNCGRLTL